MKGIVWLSKSNKTEKLLFAKLGLFGFKIISTYFPASFADLFFAGGQQLSLRREYHLLGKPHTGVCPSRQRKTL